MGALQDGGPRGGRGNDRATGCGPCRIRTLEGNRGTGTGGQPLGGPMIADRMTVRRSGDRGGIGTLSMAFTLCAGAALMLPTACGTSRSPAELALEAAAPEEFAASQAALAALDALPAVDPSTLSQRAAAAARLERVRARAQAFEEAREGHTRAMAEAWPTEATRMEYARARFELAGRTELHPSALEEAERQVAETGTVPVLVVEAASVERPP